jgi:hypothetical protein
MTNTKLMIYIMKVFNNAPLIIQNTNANMQITAMLNNDENRDTISDKMKSVIA